MQVSADRHFAILDAHRGIAAIIVLLFHICAPLHLDWVAPHGYLAVDFFFLLSGVVIDRAYGTKLRDPTFRTRFLLLRLARLWPMILIGTLVGCLVSAARLAMRESLDLAALLSALAYGLALLPFGRVPPSGFIFPFNGPLWSLFFEVVANLAYAYGFRWLRGWLLVLIVQLAGAGVACLAFAKGDLELGAQAATYDYAGGTARVFFSFLVGVLISRHAARLPRLGITAPMLTIILAGVLMSPWPNRAPLFDTIAALVVFPILVNEGLACEVPTSWRPVCRFFGDLSYPLYGIHYPIMRVFLYVQETRDLKGLVLATSVIAEIAACLIAAYFTMRFLEAPLRDVLMSRARRGIDTAPAGTMAQ
ncbi:acyltransferase family protein [Bradyrhizobium sp. CCBAU 11361]|uniref:acyltransferase family protein n=1 Tax=Bradyrhizobium sp. CCBAU 11361 TaxID=1630812 RepID=UPI002302A6F2|nr:acyltransferase [Bradyrhizobium sp. CCBAU 11361]MDA9487947.1 hypothetical protein [Bradyrhizobium sp. CCBAU 11361]